MASDKPDEFRLAVPTFPYFSGDSRAEQIAEQMTEFIGMGLLPAGSRLPSEAELALQFGVSTVTLREALATLRQRGLVTTRRGRGGGSFVEEPPAHPSMERAATLARIGLDELQDLLDYSNAIGSASAELAAVRAGPSDLERLKSTGAGLGESKTAAENRRADARFHIYLAAASHSSRLTREEIKLRGELSGLIWLVPGRDPGCDRVKEDHEAIIEAIEQRDPEAARRAASNHAAADARMLTGWHLSMPDRNEDSDNNKTSEGS